MFNIEDKITIGSFNKAMYKDIFRDIGPKFSLESN